MELRIRLAGFGGLKPGDTFDDDTATAVKIFERDVMGRTATGIVDMAFAAGLDKFAADWPISFFQLRCKCGTCGGFGDGSNKGRFNSPQRAERFHMYEYPGVHRALLWGARALMFYCAVDLKDSVRFQLIFSGYRCRVDNSHNGRHTTNHMGKALDLWFELYSNGKWDREESQIETNFKTCNRVRELATRYLKASVHWATPKEFGLEPAGSNPRKKKEGEAPTWVHMDVREWPSKFLDDTYFVKSSETLEGKPMAELLFQPLQLKP
jgi:hypothetical protein